MNRAKRLLDGWMDEMVIVGRRQDNTLAPSVSGHLHYDGNGRTQREIDRYIRGIETDSREEID
jgi:hypothetical protein